MALIQVNRLGLKSLQRMIELLLNLCGRQSVIWIVPYRKEQLGRNQITIAWICSKRLAQRSLCLARSILICGVKKIDAAVEGGLNASNRLRLFNTAGYREPRAKAQLRNLKPAVAKSPSLHSPRPRSLTSSCPLPSQSLSTPASASQTAQDRVSAPHPMPPCPHSDAPRR